jgi:hypothetical protein
MRISRTITITSLIALSASLVIVTSLSAAGANQGKPVHSVSKKSETSYSAAIEHPTWSFGCSSTTGAWNFRIDGIQVIDSTGRPWNGSTGPWAITFFGSGAVPFSQSATLQQNNSNGLFEATKTGTSANAGASCFKGATITVVGFSNHEEPLLLDGTLN